MANSIKGALAGTILKQARKLMKPEQVKTVIHLLAPEYDMMLGPVTYMQDGLATYHNCDFMKDEHFLESYKLGEETGSWGESSVQWRAFVVCWAGTKCKNLEGDFVECGVNRGGYSRTLINYIDFAKLSKKFYLLDTFQGLSERYISDKEKQRGIKEGGYEECYESVKRTFKDFNTEIIRGTVPDTLTQVKADKVCYLSIDMNCVAPEIAAAEFFWDKMVPGAIIVLDDYGWAQHYEQKLGFDAFAARRGVQVLPLPTGQGLIFKP